MIFVNCLGSSRVLIFRENLVWIKQTFLSEDRNESAIADCCHFSNVLEDSVRCVIGFPMTVEETTPVPVGPEGIIPNHWIPAISPPASPSSAFKFSQFDFYPVSFIA